jgi:predicted Fe-Mo cluster-binding NifX family protein
MKIAVTATGDQLNSDVDPRFGRCKYFIIVDTDTMAFEAVLNTPGAGGAGIAAGQLVSSHGAKAVLTGDCGPNAYQVLSAAGIEVITGVSGKVKDAVEAYKAGKYKKISQPTVEPHHGLASK